MATATTVLVMEDDEDQRDQICAAIVDDGFNAIGFDDGNRLLRYLRDAPVNGVLVVLDLMLPPPDGWQLLQELKSDPKLKDIPVVITSAAGDQEAILRLVGIEGFLVKPFEPEELLEIVRAYGNKAPRGPRKLAAGSSRP